MSKNVVDTILELGSNKIGFIPSRRQVDYNGGYVNNWTTKQFSEYVNGRVIIERDHGGVGQGYEYDDGLKSYKHDAENFSIIHVDPWKVYQDFQKGVEEVVSCIKYINSLTASSSLSVIITILFIQSINIFITA